MVSLQICLYYWRWSSLRNKMFMRVATLVFLLKTASIVSIICRRYGEKLLKEFRQFEKLDYKLRKVQLDLDFLSNCKDNDIIPNFLNFRLANKKL